MFTRIFIISLLLALVLHENQAHHRHHQRLGHQARISTHRNNHHHHVHLADVDVNAQGAEHPLKKRHNGHVHTEVISDEDLPVLNALDTGYHPELYRKLKDAENSSLCNFTATPIVAPDDFLLPADLFDVKCNHAGARCQDLGAYCCIQTWTMIRVELRHGGSTEIRINTGCVCALSLFATLRASRPQANSQE